MNSITLGDPATQAGTPFTLLMPDTRGGTISIINESAYGLDFTIQNATFRVPADTKRDISVRGQISQQATWRIANNTNAAVAPISDVVVECYGLDECPVSNIQPLMRQTNVGNTQPVSTNVSQVLNDGNTAPYLVIEATPSGAAGSQLKWNNDGSGLFGGGLASVTNAGILTLPVGAVPVASISAGDLPATTKVPVANLKAGALPSGVTLPVAQLTGTLPASQVGSGYPGASVNGAVANATNATNATTAQGLPGLAVDQEGAPQVVIGRSAVGEDLVWQTNDGTASHNFTMGKDGSLTLQSAKVSAPAAVLGPLTIGSTAPYVLVAGGGGFSSFYGISGSGSTTVSISMPLTPFAVLVNTFNGSNSTTFGSGSYTTTSVFVYQYAAMAWRAMIYV